MNLNLPNCLIIITIIIIIVFIFVLERLVKQRNFVLEKLHCTFSLQSFDKNVILKKNVLFFSGAGNNCRK